MNVSKSVVTLTFTVGTAAAYGFNHSLPAQGFVNPKEKTLTVADSEIAVSVYSAPPNAFINRDFGPECSSSITFLLDLPSKQLRLIKPMPVNIEVYPDHAIGHIPELEQFAVGSNTSEALDEMKHLLIDLHGLLEENQMNLGPIPQKQWRILNDYITKEGSDVT